MEGRRVLVTGAAGFIGANLANLLASPNDVVVVDDCYLGTPSNLDPDVEFRARSVLEDDLPVDVDVPFHFAALSRDPMHEDGHVDDVVLALVDAAEADSTGSSTSVPGGRTR